jgi:hypothetical protein
MTFAEFSPAFSWRYFMGLEVGGYMDHPDWPKMGPSPLIAICLILATRTAKGPAQWHEIASDTELEKEIEYARLLAGRVLSTGPRTQVGLARSKRARWKHGKYSAEVRQEAARFRELLLECKEMAELMAR